MKKVEHTKQSNQPLILNENLNFSMDFSFWAAEVDLLSVLVTGKKSIIEGESLKAYLQGVVEHLVLESTTIEGKREVAIAAAIKSGMSEKQIASYLRGWDQVGEKLEIDASDKLLEKATKKTLIAYQVGDNDVVAAYDEEGAIKVLGDYCGFEPEEFHAEDYGFGKKENNQVTDLTSKLNEMLRDEEGNDIETLGDWMKRVDEPEYLYGWE